MDLSDAYRVLELPAGASEDTVREARKTLAKVWHPDRHANDPELQRKAEIKLSEINAAFETIRDASFPAAASPPPAAPPVRPATTPGVQPGPKPWSAPPVQSNIEIVGRRRVRLWVIAVVVVAIGLGTYFAIVKLGTPARPLPVVAVDASADARLVAELVDATVVVPPLLDATEITDDTTGTFGIGSTRDQVRAAQGPPKRVSTVITEDWSYGFSEVRFDRKTGRVVGWSQRDRKLKTKIVPEDREAAATGQRTGFTKGSTKDEVLGAQGTPTGIDHVIVETWNYGFSSIDFDRDGKVIEWAERDVKLRIR
jgi:outer membrane protein assembly factor BamE (lipoprotein component of BamABCDE complex)